jgi:DinB superfamily
MYQSKSLIDSLYKESENHLEKAVQQWQNMPAKHLETSPQTVGWSAVQCVEHLNIYSRYYLPLIKNAIETAQKNDWKATPQYQSGWLGNYFYHTMLPKENGTLPSKMKAPKKAIPPQSIDTVAVIAEYISHQEELLRLLDLTHHISLAKPRIPISIAPFIRLKLGDVLLFLTAHTERHVLQIERTLKRDETLIID